MDSVVDELGIKFFEFELVNDNDYVFNLEIVVFEGCLLIVLVGFKLLVVMVEFVFVNFEIDYVIIDDWVDNDFDGNVDVLNIKLLVFDMV